MTYQPKTAIVLGAFGIASVLPAAVQADSAHRQRAVDDLQMAAVVDRAEGQAVVAGDYESAIQGLERKQRHGFEASTNLCVAYTKTGALAKADRACAAALELSEEAAVRRDIAVALSNLGVLKAINGDLSGARKSFTRAIELRAQVPQANDNLGVLIDARAS